MLLRERFLAVAVLAPRCFGLTYLLKTDDGFVPFSPLSSTSKYLEVISNRGHDSARTEVRNRDSRDRSTRMWTSAGQVPDAAKILSARSSARSILHVSRGPRARAGGAAAHRRRAVVKTIFIHGVYMDVHTFEVDRDQEVLHALRPCPTASL
jgi:hypothetical protein